VLPLLEDFSGDAEMAGGLRGIARLLGIIEHVQFSGDILFDLIADLWTESFSTGDFLSTAVGLLKIT
jgi:hypothetical protein